MKSKIDIKEMDNYALLDLMGLIKKELDNRHKTKLEEDWEKVKTAISNFIAEYDEIEIHYNGQCFYMNFDVNIDEIGVIKLVD